MPELPEVQTTVHGLQILVDYEITNIYIYSTKLRYKIPKNISNILKNNRIYKIYRLGKYIIINLYGDYSTIIHLGMSGRLRILKDFKFSKKKHDHFVIRTTNHVLVYNDVRRFGFIDLLKTKEIIKKKYIYNLGIDALDKKLNNRYLYNKINQSAVSIKQLLLNQNIIAGIGNIYACEILYDAKISPFIKGSDLKLFAINKLVLSIKKILTKAIKSGGSTLRDYISTDGTVGNFQNNFKVYNQEGRKIQGKKILRINQHGRSTFFCPEIQI